MSPTNRQRTDWVGWIYFAGVVMIISGILNIIYGIAAIFNPDWEVFNRQGLLLLDLSGWGWVHLVIGIIVLASGFLVFNGSLFGRMVGVIGVIASLIANFFWLPVYPLWSIVIIVVDLLVMWALIVHGDELRD